MTDDSEFGVVVIGRNEGERLRVCLASMSKYADKTVYIDSGSTDDSVNIASTMGVSIVELDMSIRFTAARARNEGFNKLIKLFSQIDYVQFVDGDCEVDVEWLQHAVDFLDRHDDVAVVCGRRRERYPDRSIYNMLCDIEWDTPVGEARACGGDAMMRVDAFKQIGGFKEDLIAGEEPELCVRLRKNGWKIWRMNYEMTLHDAAMIRFSQWWKRMTRTGYAFAEGAYLHGKSLERHWVKEIRSASVWGLLIPLITFILAYFYGLYALIVLLVYPLQHLRLTLSGKRDFRVNLLRAFFLILGKFPEAFGGLKFIINRILDTNSKIIEYK